MSTITQILADAYRKMVNPPQAVARPKWVPASINEESVPAFVQAVTEARKANESIVEFNGKKYGIKSVKEDASEEDQGLAKKIQNMDAENAPKQASDEVPAEVKEEDAEEIKMDNHDEKEADADEMPKLDDDKVEEELVGNQHKLDVNKNGKIDGDDLKKLRSEELVGNQHKLDVNKNGKIDGEDLKKLRGEEKEEDSDEMDAEPDANDMDEPSDNAADNKGEDDKEDEKEMNEVLTKKNTAADFVHDFVHSKNPKFAGKSVKQRQKMALGAYYAKQNESTNLTGEQTISSVAATYALMVNENVAGDPHAANLSAKANSATALAHTSNSETHHEDARDAHHLAAEHYRVYAHNHHDPMVRSAANIHHEFHRSMSNHHMLNLVSSDMDKEAHDMAAKHYGKKSVEEGTAADAEAGPEVMDPATQKMKDDADDETEIKDGVPGAAQDGGDKVSPADKPVAANKSAALPKVPVITAPVTTK